MKLLPPIGEATLALPCGKCIGCKSRHATSWAHRATHEAATHRYNSFITLTYADTALPPNEELRPHDLSAFIKRLRSYTHRNPQRISSDGHSGLRYLACGEYGTTTHRPHYHALLFNCDFTDKWPSDPTGQHATSDTLTHLWGHGHASCAMTTDIGGAANYIAQYTLKKTGATYYTEDGEIKVAPFLRMSRTIGKTWLLHNARDLQHGYLIHNGRRQPIPRTYKRWLKEMDATYALELRRAAYTAPTGLEYLAAQIDAKTASRDFGDRNHPDRLAASEIIHLQQKASQERL